MSGESAQPETDRKDWLADLEAKTRAAAKRVGDLRKENRTLKNRLRKLEAELTETDSGAAEKWARERDGIRCRVGRLADQLEKLLEG